MKLEFSIAQDFDSVKRLAFEIRTPGVSDFPLGVSSFLSPVLLLVDDFSGFFSSGRNGTRNCSNLMLFYDMVLLVNIISTVALFRAQNGARS